MLSFWRSGNEEKDEHFHLNILNWREAELEVLQRGKKKKMLGTRILHFPGCPRLATFQDTKQSVGRNESAMATQSGHRPRSFKNAYKREYPNRVTNQPSMPGTSRVSWDVGF